MQGTELIKAWDVVANCGDANLASNLDELDVVVKHLDDIDAAGGYKVWKETENLVPEKYKVAIFSKVKVIAKDETLPLFIKESFLDQLYYTAETLEEVTVFRRFGGGADQAKLFGGFSTTEAVLSRDELTILKKWSNMQFEVEIIVEQGVKLNLGKIAPQSIYKGGADQVLLPLNYPEKWVKTVKNLKTGKVYTLEEFKLAFPEQIRSN